MLFSHRSKNRPADLGPWPAEELKRQSHTYPDPEALPRHEYTPTPSSAPLAVAARNYANIYSTLNECPVAESVAPLPDDLSRRLVDIKGASYFMDADLTAVCAISDEDWSGQIETHAIAIVVVVEHCRIPEQDNLAYQWVAPAVTDIAQMRAGEIAACLAGHLRHMGFSARTHCGVNSSIHLEALAIRSGVALVKDGVLSNPFLGKAFSLAAITTDYQLPRDKPLANQADASIHSLRQWLGINGARSGRERNRRKRRPSHLSRYPMEQVRRVDKPTTLIIDDEVPQVPKRAAFFQRALHGDLGEKAKRERTRFAFKTPLSLSQLDAIKKLVPYQNGEVSSLDLDAERRYADPAANARAIKSLSYALGADITGICEVPRYAWFSHKEDGSEIQPYHRYAIVMVVDQGFDTMEGASGDDWMSGAQSMRSYLRGAEIAGVMAQLLRDLGFSARSQTNADSDVLQIPLMLLAGLGELSRIGELVLNPFVGPRLKSVVVTVDMPLECDRPIDFGLQYFCENCYKCARECPCDAIPFGDKVMFNGYEMWKPDVERCARYRVTNQKGSACGRCMKTCPLNKVVDADGGFFPRIASWLGINAMVLKPILVPMATRLDDWLGNGRRNLIKKWWFDHEIVDGVTVTPKATNERDIDPTRSFDASKQKIAYYNADVMPAADALEVVMVNRKTAVAAAELIESPIEARDRLRRGGPTPPHYVAPPTKFVKSGSRARDVPTGAYVDQQASPEPPQQSDLS